MTVLTTDPRSETDATLALLDHWLQKVETTTAAIRAEITRMSREGDGDASADADRKR